VREVEKEIDTVIALGAGTRCDANGAENVLAPILERLGYSLERAKTNTGLGRVTNSGESATNSAENKSEEPVGEVR
jgi:hypothetical protein